MIEQWQELKETITEMRDNDGTGTQQEVCKFLANYMDILEKQMQEPCENAIGRSDMLDAIGHGTTYTSEELQKIIKALPSVNPQPNIGHWIDDGFYAEGHSHKAFHCSRCGYNVLGFKEDLSNFCPSCGAKMVEPQESEVKE